MLTLNNGNLSAVISEKGAELKSLKYFDREYIWCGNPDVWSGTAPVLFPILGFLKDDKCIINNKEYNIPKHGIARRRMFTVESFTDNSAIFLFKSDAKTLKQYPFKFEFRVVFTLNADSLEIKYCVKNIDNEIMYFSLGAHEAYATEGVIEDYDIIFEKNETLDTMLLDGFLMSDKKLHLFDNTNILPIKEEYFKLDTLIFGNLKSKKATLKNRKNGKYITVEFPDAEYLGIWHVPNAQYLCIEPWNGLPDYSNTDFDFSKKAGIINLKANEEYINTHKIII